MSSNRLSYKVTDGGSRKLRAEVAKAKEKYGKDAWYVFHYGDHNNAAIMVEDSATPMNDWVAKQEVVAHEAAIS